MSQSPAKTLSLRDWLAASPLRLFVAFLVIASVPLVLINRHIGTLLREELISSDLQQNAETARLTGSFLQEHFRQSVALLEAVAANPELRDAWLHHDLKTVQENIDYALHLDPNFSLVSIYTNEGTMVAISPPTTDVVGNNFAYRDWYKGVAKEWKPYVSEVYRTRATKELCVAVVVPVFDAQHRPIGIIAAAYSLKKVSGWLGDMKTNTQGNIIVVDKNGRMLANPAIDAFADPVDLSGLEPVQHVLEGRMGNDVIIREGHQVLTSYRSLPELRWGVIVMEPMSRVEAQLAVARRQLWLNSSALILLALVGGLMLGTVFRKQQELRSRVEELRVSEQNYRSIIQGAIVGMYRVNDASILVANPAMVEMLRYASEAELLALPVDELFYEPGERMKIRSTFQGQEIIDGYETIWKRKDGTPINIRISGRYIRDLNGQFIYFDGIAEDISGRKYLEEQLRNSEKQAALGRMVAGAAHEINNPLTGVLGYLDLILSADGQDERKQLVGKARNQALRVRAIVANLLSFAKQRKAEKQVLDINRLLDNAMRLQDLNVPPGKISFRTSFDIALPQVWGDEYQLLQVFLHVLNNAVDAVSQEGGGIVTAVTHSAGDFINVDIEDNGHGIAEIANIFDPFYTTKEVGKGAGLGLSACYGIVQEHGGDISAENLPEGGARIRIRLPIAEDLAIQPETAEKQSAS